MPTEENLHYFQRHGNTALAHCIQCSAPQAGAHVVIVGGTHGNEPAGVTAMIEFHRSLVDGQLALKSGTVSLLLGNPEAYARNVRYLERDLNRSFANPDDATVEGRRARTIGRFLRSQPEITFVLDLHSVSIGEFKIVVFNIEKPQNEALSRKLSPCDLHLAYHPAHLPGALVDAAGSRAGLIIECGNHQSQAGRQTAREHLLRALSHFGVVSAGAETDFAPVARVTRYETIQAIVPRANFAFTIEDVSTGDFLEAGRRYAVDDHGAHTAPEDCYVVVPSRHVRPTDHDAGFLCRRHR
jgi:succinylglutamate desuccinylase